MSRICLDSKWWPEYWTCILYLPKIITKELALTQVWNCVTLYCHSVFCQFLVKLKTETDPTSYCVVLDIPHHVPGLVAVQVVGSHIQQPGRVVQELGHGGGVYNLSAGPEGVLSLVVGVGPWVPICSDVTAYLEPLGGLNHPHVAQTVVEGGHVLGVSVDLCLRPARSWSVGCGHFVKLRKFHLFTWVWRPSASGTPFSEIVEISEINSSLFLRNLISSIITCCSCQREMNTTSFIGPS